MSAATITDSLKEPGTTTRSSHIYEPSSHSNNTKSTDGLTSDSVFPPRFDQHERLQKLLAGPKDSVVRSLLDFQDDMWVKAIQTAVKARVDQATGLRKEKEKTLDAETVKNFYRSREDMTRVNEEVPMSFAALAWIIREQQVDGERFKNDPMRGDTKKVPFIEEKIAEMAKEKGLMYQFWELVTQLSQVEGEDPKAKELEETLWALRERFWDFVEYAPETKRQKDVREIKDGLAQNKVLRESLEKVLAQKEIEKNRTWDQRPKCHADVSIEEIEQDAEARIKELDEEDVKLKRRWSKLHPVKKKRGVKGTDGEESGGDEVDGDVKSKDSNTSQDSEMTDVSETSGKLDTGTSTKGAGEEDAKKVVIKPTAKNRRRPVDDEEEESDKPSRKRVKLSMAEQEFKDSVGDAVTREEMRLLENVLTSTDTDSELDMEFTVGKGNKLRLEKKKGDKAKVTVLDPEKKLVLPRPRKKGANKTRVIELEIDDQRSGSEMDEEDDEGEHKAPQKKSKSRVSDLSADEGSDDGGNGQGPDDDARAASRKVFRPRPEPPDSGYDTATSDDADDERDGHDDDRQAGAKDSKTARSNSSGDSSSRNKSSKNSSDRRISFADEPDPAINEMPKNIAQDMDAKIRQAIVKLFKKKRRYDIEYAEVPSAPDAVWWKKGKAGAKDGYLEDENDYRWIDNTLNEVKFRKMREEAVAKRKASLESSEKGGSGTSAAGGTSVGSNGAPNLDGNTGPSSAESVYTGGSSGQKAGTSVQPDTASNASGGTVSSGPTG